MLNIEQVLAEKAAAAGFTQQGDIEVARFIGALARIVRPGRALELGTGMGFTTHHILANLPSDGTFDSVENDAGLIEVAQEMIVQDGRVTLHHRPGEAFIGEYMFGEKYDFIFADTWPGKYHLLDEVLSMVGPGGVYVIDDMNLCAAWPDGHEEKAKALISRLLNLKGWTFAYYTFGTGVGVAQRHIV